MANKTARKETKAKNQKVPANVIASCILTKDFVTIKDVIQFVLRAIQVPATRNFAGKTSLVMRNGSDPTPNEKAVTKMINDVINNQLIPPAVSGSFSTM